MLPRWRRIATTPLPAIVGIPTRFEFVLERRRTRLLSWTGNIHLKSSSRDAVGTSACPLLPSCRRPCRYSSTTVVVVPCPPSLLMVVKGKGSRACYKGHENLEKGCNHHHVSCVVFLMEISWLAWFVCVGMSMAVR